jgi:Beta-propeller repeat
MKPKPIEVLRLKHSSFPLRWGAKTNRALRRCPAGRWTECLVCVTGLVALTVCAQPLLGPVDGALEPSRPAFDLSGFLSCHPDEVMTVPWTGPAFRLDRSFPLRPLAFERNDGQVNAQVKFLSRERGYTLFLTPAEAVMTLPMRNAGSGTPDFAPMGPGGHVRPTPIKARVLRMRLVGANPAIKMSGEKELRGEVNYFIGNVPARWHTNIPTFAKVRLEQVYPGIGLVYYGDQGQLEYDFTVAPGADPNQVEMAFEGADKVTLDERGDLLVRVGGQQLRWRRPRVYEVAGGERRDVPGTYRLTSRLGVAGADPTQLISFSVTGYDRAQPLVIDPDLVYSTYLGGSTGNEMVQAVTADAEGNAYVTGFTRSTDFPTRKALQTVLRGESDAIAAKLSPTGDLIYSTYLGGSGSENTFGPRSGIAVDAAGNAYVIGSTDSQNFPVMNPLQRYLRGVVDAFVAKLSPDGASLVYSTYLGGPGGNNSGGNWGMAIAVDHAGQASVGGTGAPGFPTTNALYSYAAHGGAFLAKLTPRGDELAYSTYLGADSDWVDAIAIDSLGNSFVCGATSDANFPTQNPAQSQWGGGRDGFVLKINPSGSELLFSTYLGGSGNDMAEGVTLGQGGDVYIVLSTSSIDFPLTDAFQLQGNMAAVRMKPDGSSIAFSTYLGTGNDSPAGVGTDQRGDLVVAGSRYSPDLPGEETGFVTVLKGDGSGLLFSSSFFSPTSDSYVLGGTVDPTGNVYLAGYTGAQDFPVTNAFQPALRGGFDAFLAKLSLWNTGPLLTLTRTGTTVALTWPADATGFTLETAAQLGPAASWAAAAEQPVVIGDQNVVTLDATNVARFFRLTKP